MFLSIQFKARSFPVHKYGSHICSVSYPHDENEGIDQFCFVLFFFIGNILFDHVNTAENMAEKTLFLCGTMKLRLGDMT